MDYIPSDVWSYIKNFYLLLKYKDELDQFKEIASGSCRCVFPPKEILKMPISPICTQIVSVCTKITRFYRKDDGVLFGIGIEAVSFIGKEPDKFARKEPYRQLKGRKEYIWVDNRGNHDDAIASLDRDLVFGLIDNRHIEMDRIVVNIPVATLPDHVRRFIDH